MLTSGISMRVVVNQSALHGLKGNRLFKGGRVKRALAVFGKKVACMKKVFFPQGCECAQSISCFVAAP